MNEKIKTLVKELQQECRKEGVAAICTLQRKGHVINMLVGDATDVAFCLAVQEKELNENLPLPSNVIDNEEDLADVMTRILKGEFE